MTDKVKIKETNTVIVEGQRDALLLKDFRLAHPITSVMNRCQVEHL